MHARRWTAAAVLCGALATGCGGGDDAADPAPSSTPTTAADGTTLPGTELGLTESAVVLFGPDTNREAAVQVTVRSVTQGKIGDLKQFDLPADARTSNVFYVKTDIENQGPADIGGQFVTLYGKVSDSMVVQPVTFGSTFKACNYQPLPKKFTKGKQAKVCMVFLAPKHGTVSAVEWRGPDDQAPVSWLVAGQS